MFVLGYYEGTKAYRLTIQTKKVIKCEMWYSWRIAQVLETIWKRTLVEEMMALRLSL